MWLSVLEWCWWSKNKNKAHENWFVDEETNIYHHKIYPLYGNQELFNHNSFISILCLLTSDKALNTASSFQASDVEGGGWIYEILCRNLWIEVETWFYHCIQFIQWVHHTMQVKEQKVENLFLHPSWWAKPRHLGCPKIVLDQWSVHIYILYINYVCAHHNA